MNIEHVGAFARYVKAKRQRESERDGGFPRDVPACVTFARVIARNNRFTGQYVLYMVYIREDIGCRG